MGEAGANFQSPERGIVWTLNVAQTSHLTPAILVNPRTISTPSQVGIYCCNICDFLRPSCHGLFWGCGLHAHLAGDEVVPETVDCTAFCGAELGSQDVVLLRRFPQLSTAGPLKPGTSPARLSRGSGTEGTYWPLGASQPEEKACLRTRLRRQP